ncbi:FHA domain-containing protein [bacterium]|nr:FHA domain-containing protein [bacterium]
MGKLTVMNGAKTIRTVELEAERTTIGRHPDNDIQLQDNAVSGKHAVVMTILSDSFLEDLNSTNGTLVNGRQVAKHPLADGDVVTLGQHTLRYESAVQVDESALEQTMILRPGQMAAAAEQAGERLGAMPAAEPSKPLAGKLRLMSGANAGRELELTKALTTIGRPGIQVAAVTRRPDGFYLVHVGGQDSNSKRPVVNGESIGVHARQLENGDTIELAGAKLTFVAE